jgi:hypothetical protein
MQFGFSFPKYVGLWQNHDEIKVMIFWSEMCFDKNLPFEYFLHTVFL